MLEQLGINAKKAAGVLTTASTNQKNKALEEIALALIENADKIIEQNKIDLENGRKE